MGERGAGEERENESREGGKGIEKIEGFKRLFCASYVASRYNSDTSSGLSYLTCQERGMGKGWVMIG